MPTLLPYAGDAGFIEAVRSGPDDLFALPAGAHEVVLRYGLRSGWRDGPDGNM